MTDDLLYAIEGELVRAPLSELRRLPHEALEPLREPTRFKGQINRGGYHASTLTGTQEPFESLLEWKWIRRLEFDLSIDSIRSQCLYLGDGVDHYPDLLLRTTDGRTVVADVRAAALFNDHATEKFAATRDVCRSVGVDYVVLDDTDPLLTAYEHYTRHRHPDRVDPDAVAAVLAAADRTPRPLQRFIDASDQPTPQTVAAVRHLLFTGRLHAETMGEWPEGISDRTGRWRDDPRRNLPLDVHAWDHERMPLDPADRPDRHTTADPPAKVPHTKPWPPDAINSKIYDPAEVVRVNAAYDALSRYAEAVCPDDYPGLAEWSRLLPGRNRMRGLTRPQAAAQLSAVLDSHEFGAGRSNRSVLLRKCEDARTPLVLLHGNRTPGPVEDTHDRWFEAAADHQLRNSDGPDRLVGSRIYEIDEEFAQLWPTLSLPSRDTKVELLKSAEQFTRTVGRRTTVRSNTSVPSLYAYWHEVVPGHLQMDTTNFAVRLLHPTLPGLRVSVEISALFDTASRQPVAIVFHKPGTPSEVVLDLLLQTLTRPPQDDSLAYIGKPLSVAIPADWPDDGTTVGLAGRPHPTVVALEVDPDTETGRLVPRPAMSQIAADVITIDGGSAENSRRTKATLHQLSISVVFANKRTGHHKPHIERWFRTLKTMISQELGGHTGGSVDRRGRDPDIEAEHTPDELERHVLAWVHDEWRNRRVRFHNRFGRPFIDLSPNQYVELSGEIHGWSAPTVDVEDVIAAMHKDEKALDRARVRNDHRTYFHPELRRYQGRRTSSRKRNNRYVTIAYPHPGSDYVYVLLPKDPPEWLYVPASSRHRPTDADPPPACVLYDLVENLDATRIAKSKQEVAEATRRRNRGPVGPDHGIEEHLDRTVVPAAAREPRADDAGPPDNRPPPGPAPTLEPTVTEPDREWF